MAGNDLTPGSLRPDGSRRKHIDVRPGYVNQDEVPKYVIPQRRFKAPEPPAPAKSSVPQAQVFMTGDHVQQDVKNQSSSVPRIEPNITKRIKRKRNQKSRANRDKNESDSASIDALTKQMSSVALENKKALHGNNNKQTIIKSPLSDCAKELRKALKKLREIASLEKKQALGKIILNDEELQKLAQKAEIKETISKLELKLADH